MMSYQVRLKDNVDKYIKASYRDDETFCDVVERLIGGRSLHDFSDFFDDQHVNEMRDVIDAANLADCNEN